MFKIVRRILEGSVLSIFLITIISVFGASETINLLIADRSLSSILFLIVIAIVLADIIAKLISILDSTLPDLVPKLDDDDVKRASLIRRLRPGQTVALLSGAYAARIVFFLIIFLLLGASYAAAPLAVQESLFGDYGTLAAVEIFLREGIAGSVGYFLFFIGPENLRPITQAMITQPLEPATLSGDVFLAGIRIYGFAFVLATLRTLVTPITFLRARLRADKIPASSSAPD